MELFSNLILSNPLGLWALSGIPLVVLIHFLQRQSEEITISTLFLLQQMQRESVEGRRFERIRSSVPLWLQILMVLLLTWLICQPRVIRSDSVQPIAIVLDSSASMTAFEEEVREQLLAELRELQGKAQHTEYYLIESSLATASLYRGQDLAELELALNDWNPAIGEHDFGPALRVARNLVGRQGLVVMATDHFDKEEDLPFDATLLAVGKPKTNLGFAGLRIGDVDGEPRWTAMIRNYSDQPVEREWFLASGQQRSARQTISLAPGEIRSIEGPFPENAEFCTLQLAPDAFPPDDVLPMARPQPRTLTLRPVVTPGLDDEAAQVADSISHSRVLDANDPGQADITIVSYDPLRPSLPDSGAIVFMEHPIKQNSVVTGKLISENHELINHLNWEPLIVRRSLQIPRREIDKVLLWQDERPLIMLREFGATRQLLFNFDLKGSNALKLPAFIILVHRFAESIREQKPSLERRVVETGQPLQLVLPPEAVEAEGAEETQPKSFRFAFQSWDGANDFEAEIPRDDVARQRAPIYPGYLKVWYGEQKILEASTFFADTREADLRQAAFRNDLSGVGDTLVERNTETDANWMVWVLVLAVILILSWAWIAWRQARIQAGASEEGLRPSPARG